MVQIKKINSRRLYHFAVDTFVSIISQLRNRKFNYKCSNRDLEAWDYFIHRYQNSILGEDYIRLYIEFAINRWYVQDERDVKAESCKLLNIFSKRAVAEWENTNPQYRAYIVRKELKHDYEINYKKKSKLSEIVNSVIISEEKARKMYLNTPRGLAWCIANTSLYFHRSKYCSICDFKMECKEIERKQYPNVYRKRGYK